MEKVTLSVILLSIFALLTVGGTIVLLCAGTPPFQYTIQNLTSEPVEIQATTNGRVGTLERVTIPPNRSTKVLLFDRKRYNRELRFELAAKFVRSPKMPPVRLDLTWEEAVELESGEIVLDVGEQGQLKLLKRNRQE